METEALDPAILRLDCLRLAQSAVTHPNDVIPLASAFAAFVLGDTAPDAVDVEPARPEPAVSIRASVKPDYIVCLEDGKKLKMLKRYLRTHFDMSPEQYRARWGLPASYPMTAPNYADRRRALAIKSGLGRKPGRRTARH